MAKYASLNAPSSASSGELNYTEIAVTKTGDDNSDENGDGDKKKSIWVTG